MKLSEILKNLNIVQELQRDVEITNINSLSDAKNDTLSYAISAKFTEELKNTKAAAVFVTAKIKEYLNPNAIAIIVENPELYMAYSTLFFKKRIELPKNNKNNIDQTAKIFPNVNMGNNITIGKNSIIMSGAYIGDDVKIGENSIIYPNVVIYHECIVGNRCIIHANSVIGSDGFGYAHTKTGEHIKIYQNGNVIIEDGVEIGSNTSIDRAVFNSTIIKSGTKIDNLVQISHNTIIGENSIIAGQTGIAGSTVLGKNVTMAAQSGAVGHVKIADFTTVAARGGVTKNTEAGKTYSGFPIMEHKSWLKLQAKLARLLKS